jgi:hypothetical protein
LNPPVSRTREPAGRLNVRSTLAIASRRWTKENEVPRTDSGSLVSSACAKAFRAASTFSPSSLTRWRLSGVPRCSTSVEKKCAIEECGACSRGALRTRMRIRSCPGSALTVAASAVDEPLAEASPERLDCSGRNRSRKERSSEAS